jgi:hypothetical protein
MITGQRALVCRQVDGCASRYHRSPDREGEKHVLAINEGLFALSTSRSLQNLLGYSWLLRLCALRQVRSTHTRISYAYCASCCPPGDCDTDDDCEGDLVCYQIDSGSVPGCSGSTTSKTDFCAKPTQQAGDSGQQAEDSGTVDGMTSDGGTGSNFFLKIYWEADFMWQETTREWKWCVQCVGDDPGSWSRLVDCDSGSPTRLTFDRIGTTDDFRIRVDGSDLCLQLPQTSEDYSNFELCDGSDNQIWTAQNGSPFTGDTFEIAPKLLPGFCLTNTHHPKPNERSWVGSCEYARHNHTNRYMVYKAAS